MTDKAVTLHALMAVIERHKLEPVNGEYHFTDEMLAEAAAIDEAWGDRPLSPEQLEDLKAAMEGKPNSGKWEEVDLDEIAEERSRDRTRSQEVTTDDAYADLLVKLRKLFVGRAAAPRARAAGGDPDGGRPGHCRTGHGRAYGEGMVLEGDRRVYRQTGGLRH
jgi:hypothetical protein